MTPVSMRFIRQIIGTTNENKNKRLICVVIYITKQSLDLPTS